MAQVRLQFSLTGQAGSTVLRRKGIATSFRWVGSARWLVAVCLRSVPSLSTTNGLCLPARASRQVTGSKAGSFAFTCPTQNIDAAHRSAYGALVRRCRQTLKHMVLRTLRSLGCPARGRIRSIKLTNVVHDRQLDCIHDHDLEGPDLRGHLVRPANKSAACTVDSEIWAFCSVKREQTERVLRLYHQTYL